MLDAEDIQGKRRRADRYDAVFADDAVLFATAHQFAGKERSGRLLRLTKTSWFTEAPVVWGIKTGRPSRPRTISSEPRSRMRTSPVAKPSSKVKKAPASCS